jgi:deoxyribodipyrimidine photo-lyase
MCLWQRKKPTPESGLLLSEEDGYFESLPLNRAMIKGVAGVICTPDRSPLDVSTPALAFADGAVADGVARAANALACPGVVISERDGSEALIDWARSQGFHQLLTAYAPVGPVQERLDRLAPALAGNAIRLVRLQRPWDQALWPQATQGFFQFKNKVPVILKQLGSVIQSSCRGDWSEA